MFVIRTWSSLHMQMLYNLTVLDYEQHLLPSETAGH